MELVHVQQPRKRVEVPMSEELRADLRREPIWFFDQYLGPIFAPANNRIITHSQKSVNRPHKTRNLINRDHAPPSFRQLRRGLQGGSSIFHALLLALRFSAGLLRGVLGRGRRPDGGVHTRRGWYERREAGDQPEGRHHW